MHRDSILASFSYGLAIVYGTVACVWSPWSWLGSALFLAFAVSAPLIDGLSKKTAETLRQFEARVSRLENKLNR